MTELEKPQRKLDHWITSFIEYTDIITSPRIFRLWTAVAVVSAAMERRQWTITKRDPLYPNIWVLLVGRPGVGKSQAISAGRSILHKMGKINLAPDDMTKAAFIDELAEAKKIMTIEGLPMSYHSLTIAATEFGTLVPDYDLKFLNTLNKAYDCEQELVGRTRALGKTTIENPHLLLLSGTQPKYLNDLLPESAFGMGFTSRLLFIYSDEVIITPMFQTDNIPRDRQLYNNLVSDLQSIYDRVGPYDWTQSAQDAINDWLMSGQKPMPEHPRLQNYVTRRVTHLIKLCMVFAAAKRQDLTVTIEDFEEALSLLIATEDLMPEVFKSMAVSPDAQIIEEAFLFVQNRYMKTGQKPVNENALVHFLATRAPAHMISYILRVLETSGMLQDVSGGIPPKAYKPISFHPEAIT